MRIDWEKTKIRLNCVGRSHWEAGVTVSRFYDKDGPRNDQTLVQFRGGRGWVNTRAGDVELRQGMCLWMRAGRGYDIRQEPRQPLAMTFLHFDLLDPAGHLLPLTADLPPEVLYPANTAHTESLAYRIVELIHGKAEDFAWVPAEKSVRQTATALLTGLLMDLDYGAATRPVLVGVRHPGTERQRLQSDRIMRMANELMESQGKLPTVAEMARKAGYSQPHFSRLFREVVSHGARDFLIRVRISRASHLLLNTSLPIGEIADTLGYRDIFHFSKQFKQQTWQTPTSYRRRRGIRLDEPAGNQTPQGARKHRGQA